MVLYKNSGIKEVDFVEIKNNYLKNLVSNVTLDEKIGQLFTVICEGGIYLPAMESLIADYHCGGLRVVPAVRYSQKLFVDKAKRQQGKSGKNEYIGRHLRKIRPMSRWSNISWCWRDIKSWHADGKAGCCIL